MFARPGFQSSVASVTGTHRGVPDVSLSAAIDGAAIIYLSGSYSPVGGISWASPTFAGIVAIADQVAGHDLGDLNPAQGGKSYTVKGCTAVKGYDLASGLGTVDGAKLVTALAATHP